MPLYNYRCESCNHKEKIMCSDWREHENSACPGCGKPEFRYRPWEREEGDNSWGLVSPERLGRNKAPRDFRDYLTAVGKVNPGHKMRLH